MRRINQVSVFLICLLAFLFYNSCDDKSDGQRKDTEKENPVNLGNVESIKSFSGIEKIKLTWVQTSDPKVQRTIIYWNAKKDSIIKEFNRTTSGVQKDSIVIRNLIEKSYTFEFKNVNDKKESSIYSRAIGYVWGNEFSKNLLKRIVTKLNYDRTTSFCTLNLSSSVKGDNLLYSQIKYNDKQGVEKVFIIDRDSNVVVLSDIPYGDKLGINSAFFFPQGFDTIFSEYSSHNASVRYSNPIINKSLPDPSIIKAKDGYFYVYATEDIRNTPIHRSKDLVTWEFVGTAFTNKTRPVFEPGGGLWAPEINYINGKYVLYYSMSKWGGTWTCGIGAATADSPKGPFTDHGRLFNSTEIDVKNSIDQCYVEDDGKQYLFWGSFNGIYGIELSGDGLSVKPGAGKVKIAGTAYEAALIHKTKNGYYYLFASWGSCCEQLKSTYTTVVGRSSTLFGPYLDKKGNSMMNNRHEILIQKNANFVGTGHNSQIVKDDKGQDWIFYHAVPVVQPDSRVLMMDQLLWDTNDWPYINGNTPSLEAEAPFFGI